MAFTDEELKEKLQIIENKLDVLKNELDEQVSWQKDYAEGVVLIFGLFQSILLYEITKSIIAAILVLPVLAVINLGINFLKFRKRERWLKN